MGEAAAFVKTQAPSRIPLTISLSKVRGIGGISLKATGTKQAWTRSSQRDWAFHSVMQVMYCTSRFVSSGCCKVLCRTIACSDYFLEGEDCQEDGGQNLLGLFVWQEILPEAKLINTRPTSNFSVSTSRLLFSRFHFEWHLPIYTICSTVLKRVLGWKHMSLNQKVETTVGLIKIAWKPQT